MGRSPCCDKTKVKRGTWSPEEDATLKNFLHKHGTAGNWIALPQKAGLRRCGKSCRLRWLNYLRPDIKHGGFTQEEEDIICSLYNKIGSRWSVIASQLQGRTDNDVKNYWNTKLKKKVLQPSDKHFHTKCNTENTPAAEETTIFRASTNSPAFSDPFSSVVEPRNSNMPRLILEGSSNNNCPSFSPQSQQDFKPFGFGVEGNYYGASGISIDEGFGDYCYSNADLFSTFSMLIPSHEE